MPHDAGYPEPPSNPPPARPETNAVAGRIEPSAPPPVWDAPPPAALSAAPDLKGLLQGLRRRWITAVTLGGTLAAIAAATAGYLAPAKYTAGGLFRVASLPPSVLPDRNANRSEFTQYSRTQASLVRSRKVIGDALKLDEVKRLNLEARETDPITLIEEEL